MKRQKLLCRLDYNLFYYAPRSRKDLQLVTSFLVRRVRRYSEKDYRKLRQLINYVCTTKDKECLIRVEDIGVVHMCTNASYTTYLNTRSYSREAISFRIGLITSILHK